MPEVLGQFVDFLPHEPRDFVAAGALAIFVSTIAYLHHPRLKAMVYSMPVPFTCAYLATDLPINATHFTGLLLILGYNWMVYYLRIRRQLPLGLAIACSIAGYIACGALFRPLAGSLPWPVAAVGALVVWGLAVMSYRPIDEPGHRSPMAWWIKAPLVFMIGSLLYRATALLGGAVTTFPYAGLFTSYEARRSLRTLAGQFTINLPGIWLLIALTAMTEPLMSRYAAIAIGWVGTLSYLGLVRWRRWGQVPIDIIE